MTLDMYRLPLGVTEGVVISLPKTDIIFRVALPATCNEEFQSQLISTMNMQIDVEKEDFDVDFDAGLFQKAHKELFFDTCILEATNLPDGMDASAFFKEYPLAARLIHEKALELAKKSDEEVNAALGKLSITPNGRSSGKAA